MRVNLGPQHPSTHGVLRLRTEVLGETIVNVEPIIGYLHTGIEKQAETLNWIQAVTDVTRADYLSQLLQRARVLPRRREARGCRSAAARAVDPHADVRVQPHLVAPRVARDRRAGAGRDVDGDVRVPRTRDDPRLLSGRHRRPDEPRVLPSGWCEHGPASRAPRHGARACATLLPATVHRVRELPARTTRSGSAATRASASSSNEDALRVRHHRTEPARGRHPARPPQGAEPVPAVRPGGLRRAGRRARATATTATSSGWRSCTSRSGSAAGDRQDSGRSVPRGRASSSRRRATGCRCRWKR